MEKEVWRKIENLSDYMISNKGRVRSLGLDKYHKPRVLKHGFDKDGYPFVILMKDNTRNMRKIHRLVAQEFIPNPENKPQVNHINGMKSDNRVENLEWCTNEENKKHSAENQLESWGERHYRHKLTVEDVKEIRRLYKEGITQDTLTQQFPVNQRNISQIVNYKTWRYI